MIDSEFKVRQGKIEWIDQNLVLSSVRHEHDALHPFLKLSMTIPAAMKLASNCVKCKKKNKLE